jgi:hypothetical protein
MKEKLPNDLSIKDCYRGLKEGLAELIRMEREKTFSPNQLQEWIIQLQNFSLECPCELLSYDIEDDNCHFYTCKDLEPLCEEDCKNCNVTCDNCKRASHWIRIRFFTEELDRVRQTNMWSLLVCKYLTKNLQKLSFNEWFQVFLQEKGLSNTVIEFDDPKNRTWNYMPIRIIQEFLTYCSEEVQEKFKSKLIELEFCNMNIATFLEYTARSIAMVRD